MARAPKPEQERAPHDAITGASLPRETTVLVGHHDAERALLDAYRSGRMHHAWLIAGPGGIGKATLAFRVARFLFAHPDADMPEVRAALDLAVRDDLPAAARLAAGTHGNMLHLQREWQEKTGKFSTQLTVDTVRRIIPFLGNTAAEAGWRVVIVDRADEMNASAANALLKNLEEPPRRTLFLLITDRPGGLLPTIRSRCRLLTLSPLSPEETLDAARVAVPDLGEGGDLDLASALAGGSVRRFIEMARGEGAEAYRLLRRSLEGADHAAQFRLATLAADRVSTRLVLDLYEGYLTRRIHGQPEPDRAADGEALRRVPLVTWATLWDNAARSGAEVEEYNLDRRHFILDLLEQTAAAIRAARPN